jgi:ABC-2 type transport system permease protein
MNPNYKWVGYRTIVRKEITRIVRIWGQTIVPPVITMSLYFIIFGELIGRRIGEMDGFTYIQYIVPGLVIMSVITNSYGNMVSSFFGAKFGKHIEELLISPLPNWVILAGYVTGAVSRGLMVGLVVLLVSLFFTRIEMQHPMIMLMMLVLTAVVFSLAGMVNAIFAQKFDDIAIMISGSRFPPSIPSCIWLTGFAWACWACRMSACNKPWWSSSRQAYCYLPGVYGCWVAVQV